MTENLLEVSALQMRFGGLVALDEVSFAMPPQSIVSVIGPNGAGKTTLFNCITGMYRPSSGGVTFAGADITAARAHEVARRGIARTFQNLALFGGLTVLENLLVGAYREGSSGLLGGALLVPGARAEQRRAVAQAHELLGFLGHPEIADQKPAELPYGRQKQVEFARALMQKARLVLLDEPMAGMSAAEKAAMTELIARVRTHYGISFLIVEHDMPMVMSVSDRIVVLDFGRKIAEGTAAEVQSNEAVITAYLAAIMHQVSPAAALP